LIVDKGKDLPQKEPYANPSLSKLQFSFSQTGGNRMEAHYPGRTGPDADKPVGLLEWDKKSGEIMKVGTHPDFARTGLATVLMSQARAHSAASQDPNKPMKGQRSLFRLPARGVKPVVAPEHSTVRTAAGDKWAHAVGGHIPPLATAGRRQR